MTTIISILVSTIGVLFVAFVIGHAFGFLWTSIYCISTRSSDPMGVKKSAAVMQIIFFVIASSIAIFLSYQITRLGIWWLSAVFVLPGLLVALMFFSANMKAALQSYK